MTGLDKTLLGEFLAKDKGLNKGLITLKNFMKKIDFKDMKFLDSLRFLFTRMNLPKDASLILTIIDEFTKAYYENNNPSNDYKNSDALYLISSGILALNTMFTRTDIKNLVVMKKEDFIKMNKDCSESFASNIYDELKEKNFEFTEDYNEIIHKKFRINKKQILIIILIKAIFLS